MSTDPKVKDIMHKFKQAREKRQHRDAIWEELDKFDRGEQWQGNIPPWIPKPVTNMVHLVKTTKRAAFAIENPTGVLRPLSPGDRQNVDDLNKVKNYVWEKTNSRGVIREILETGKLLGDGIIQVYWEENELGGGTGNRHEGEIKVVQVDPSSFFPDPSAHTLEDCEYIHVVRRRSIDWVKNHPKFKSKASELTPTSSSGEEIGEIYTRDETTTGREKIIDFHSHYYIDYASDGEKEYRVAYLAGDKLLHDQALQPNCFPFEKYSDYPQRQDFWSKSSCEYVLDNQKLLNKVEQIIAVIGTMLQNPQSIVSKASGIRATEAKKYSQAPGHVFVTNGSPAEAMIWRQPPQIPQALFNLAEQAKQNIREITGITQSYTGESVGSLQTSAGVSQMIERATMRDRDQMFDLEQFIEKYVRLLIKFVTSYYEEERFLRVLNPDESDMEFFAFVGTEYDTVDYDFHVDVSSELPMSKQRQLEEAEKLLNLQGQYQFDPPIITTREFMRMSRFAKSDEILERMTFDEENSLQQIMMQAVEMLQDAEVNDLPVEEAMGMAEQMIAQHLEARNQGTGSTTDQNADGFQQRQQGVQMPQ